jgi:protein involved in polysaccharide export with SLBB domain
MNMSRFSFFVLATLLGGACAFGQTQPAKNANTTGGAQPGTNSGAAMAPLIMATDPGYRLSLGDEISIVVHGEDDISTAQRIDKKGNIRMPLINEVNLSEKTVREAESYIEQILIDKKLLKKPLVNITVRDYSLREIVITGTGLTPGVFPLPRETASIELTELVTRLGGFRPTAKSDAVKVIRTDDNGKETTQTVDVESMLIGKRNALKSFLIYPGDRIFVDERLF